MLSLSGSDRFGGGIDDSQEYIDYANAEESHNFVCAVSEALHTRTDAPMTQETSAACCSVDARAMVDGPAVAMPRAASGSPQLHSSQEAAVIAAEAGVESCLISVVGEEEDIEAVDLETSQTEAFLSKRRRLDKGVQESMSRFQHLFEECSRLAGESISHADKEVARNEFSILEHTRQLRMYVHFAISYMGPAHGSLGDRCPLSSDSDWLTFFCKEYALLVMDP